MGGMGTFEFAKAVFRDGEKHLKEIRAAMEKRIQEIAAKDSEIIRLGKLYEEVKEAQDSWFEYIVNYFEENALKFEEGEINE